MKKRINSGFTFMDIRGVQNLRRLGYILGERPTYLTELAIQKNNYYNPYTDTKGKKPRDIDRPTGELLAVQTKIRDRILDLIPLSKVVYGAVEGKSTKDNAEKHLRQDTLVKLDLHDCFHSSKSRMVRRLFKNRLGYADHVADLLTELCTYNGCVPVGSTLSAALVNHILDPLWQKVDKHCFPYRLTFTTWIDDIAISGKGAEKLISSIKRMINDYGFIISWNKLEIQRQNSPQIVTGYGVNTRRVTVPVKKRFETAKAIKENPNSPNAVGKLNYMKYANSTQANQMNKLRDKLINATIASPTRLPKLS